MPLGSLGGGAGEGVTCRVAPCYPVGRCACGLGTTDEGGPGWVRRMLATAAKTRRDVEIQIVPAERVIGLRRAVEPGVSGVREGECPETSLFVRALIVRAPATDHHRLERIALAAMAGPDEIVARHFAGRGLQQLVAAGATHLERLPPALVPYVFGGGPVPPVDAVARDCDLPPGHAAVVMFEHFAMQSEAVVDGLRVEVDAGPHGVWVQSIPIEYPSVQDATFPVAGPAFVMASWDDVHVITHRRLQSQEFALDVVRLEDDGRIWPASAENACFRCYGLDVLALRSGVVVRSSDGYPDNPRAGEWLPEADVAALETIHGAFSSLVGNHVILQHDDGTHSLYGHLRPGSVRVGVGYALNAGEALGEIGNSGRSG